MKQPECNDLYAIPGDIYAASVAVERHYNPEEAFAFDFPSSEPVL